MESDPEDTEELAENKLTEVIPISPSHSVTTISNGIKTTVLIDEELSSPSQSSPSSPPPPTQCTPSSSPKSSSSQPAPSPLLLPLSPPPKTSKPKLLDACWNMMKCRSGPSWLISNDSPSLELITIADDRESDCKENGEMESTGPPHFLEIYWNMIRFPCNSRTGNVCSKTLTLIRRTCWILVLSLTTFDTLTRIKDSMLDVKNAKSNVESTQAKLVTMAYRIAQLLLKFAFIITATRTSSVPIDALKSFNPRRHPKLTNLPIAVITVITVVSFGCAFGGLGVLDLNKEWSLANLSYNHFLNSYDRVVVWHKSHEDPPIPSKCFFYIGALFGYVMHFASRLVELSIQCLLCLSTISFFFEVKEASNHMKKFNREIQKPNVEEAGLTALKGLGNTIMAEYETQKRTTREMNGTFGIMFAFIHSTNLTLFVFWIHSAYSDFEIGEFVWMAIEVCIFGLSYIIAVCVAFMASGYEDWILQDRTREVMNIAGSKFTAMLHEIKNSPIGIGSGILYINFDFLVKFALLAFQAFMVLLRAAISTVTK